MTKLRWEDARADLESILMKGTTKHAREGAAHALLQLGGPTATAHVVDAINRGILDPKMGGALHGQDIDDAFVLAWLGSEQAHQRQAAFHLVRDRLRFAVTHERVSKTLATAVKQAIDQGRVDARPRARQLFNEFLRER